MRRPTAAVAGTLAGTALLIGLKLGTSSATIDSASAATNDNPPAAGGQAADPGAASAPPGSRTPRASTRPRTGTEDSDGGGNASGLRDGLFTGAPATNEYGTIQVTIIVARGRLTKVNATYPTAGRSAQINARAIPALRQEALTAQSARIETVSGASFTSASYRASLQAALTKAGT